MRTVSRVQRVEKSIQFSMETTLEVENYTDVFAAGNIISCTNGARVVMNILSFELKVTYFAQYLKKSFISCNFFNEI